MDVAAVVALTGAEIGRPGGEGRVLRDIASLERAGPEDVSYCENRRFSKLLRATRAGACFVRPGDVELVPDGTVPLVTAQPHRAYTMLGRHLYPESLRPQPIGVMGTVSPLAAVDHSALIESGVTIDPFAVIGAGAEIGAGSFIGSGTVIGAGVRIGRDSAISAGVTVTHALLGNRVILHPGVRIGQDGFGVLPGAGGHLKIPQTGRVIIQDDVEIGANSTVDRGSSRDTILGEGTKIDNLVQIAHNVVIGRHCLIAGNTGISGSATLGDFVVLGGGVGVRDNVTIGSGARVAGASGVSSDIPPGETWGGYPAIPVEQWQQERKAYYRLVRATVPAPGEKNEDR